MESSNTNNSSFNEFEDLGAETRRYMAEHMDEFSGEGHGEGSPSAGRPDFDGLAAELRRFIEQDVGAGSAPSAPASAAVPQGAGEETRRFMAADVTADLPVYKDAQPLPRRAAHPQQPRPGEQAPRRPVRSDAPSAQGQSRPRQESPYRRPPQVEPAR